MSVLVVMVCWVETMVPLVVGVILVLNAPGVTEAARLALGETRVSPVTAWESSGMRKKEPAIKDSAKTAMKAMRSSNWTCPLVGLRVRFALGLRWELRLELWRWRGRKTCRSFKLFMRCLI